MQTEEIIPKLKEQLIEALNLEEITPDDIDADAPLFGDGLGLDSIDALEIILILEKNYGIRLENTAEAKPHFYSVRTLAEYRAGEIQLESLKLLPGTAMRLHAAEWGIRYSSYPPYEVLQTDAITPDELQTARQLSRLLDAYYNTPAWQDVTRQLIGKEERFLHDFLAYLVAGNLIDQPMSLEKRGIVLYSYCKQTYPDFAPAVTRAWIEAGMSLKKEPAEQVQTKRLAPPARWQVTQGVYRPDLRLCFLPTGSPEEGHGWWYGFETQVQKAEPVFKAQS